MLRTLPPESTVARSRAVARIAPRHVLAPRCRRSAERKETCPPTGVLDCPPLTSGPIMGCGGERHALTVVLAAGHPTGHSGRRDGHTCVVALQMGRPRGKAVVTDGIPGWQVLRPIKVRRVQAAEEIATVAIARKHAPGKWDQQWPRSTTRRTISRRLLRRGSNESFKADNERDSDGSALAAHRWEGAAP